MAVPLDPTKAAVLNRLVSRICKDANDKGCWTLDTSVQDNGYSRVRMNGRVDTGHSVMYQLKKGPVPDGMEIGHTCDTRNCVRPGHLKAITHADNMVAVSRGWAARKAALDTDQTKARSLLDKQKG